MSDENIGAEGTESIETETATEESGRAPAIHPAEFRKAQKAARDLAKQNAELLAKLKQHEEQGLSEAEKLRARAAELEPIAAEAAELRALIESRRDEALARLPKEAREKLGPVVEGLPPHKALSLIESVALLRGEEPRQANVPRGGAPRPQRTVTLEQIERNPEAAGELSREELAGLLEQSGIKTGGRVWG